MHIIISTTMPAITAPRRLRKNKSLKQGWVLALSPENNNIKPPLPLKQYTVLYIDDLEITVNCDFYFLFFY